ncbi:SEC-C domain-containing protein [Myxococcota bacterium]|nr:SEC-C domain-containing protein [Myxococcota bacterium]MBU1897512.1 SEC-C domain-containing protein [Myxococcota bacterium]
MSKIGRNDPCHCGSGKKYKKCHEQQDEARKEEERGLKNRADWLRVYSKRLRESLGAQAMALPDLQERVEIFFEAPPSSPLGDRAFEDHVLYDAKLEGEPLIQQAVVDAAESSADRQLLLRSCLASSAVSLLEVMECKRQRGLRLQDHLTGEVMFVADAELAAILDPMEVILGRLVRFEEKPTLLDGWEKVPFRRRKRLIADLIAERDASLDAEATLDEKQAWLKRAAPSIYRRARAS